MSRVTSRPGWLVALVLLIQGAVLVSLLIPVSDPRRAPVALVAPPIVSAVLVEQANALPQHPFDAAPADSKEAALAELESGNVVAALVLDLATQRDLLLLEETNGQALNTSIRGIVQSLTARRGRDLDVQVLPGSGRSPMVPALLVLIAMLLGFGAAIVATWRRGPVEGSLAGGMIRQRRFALLAVACAALAGALALATGVAVLPIVVLTFLLVLIAAVATAALQSLFDTVGLVVATLLFTVTAAPLVRGLHPALLPEPWSTLTPWLARGAGLRVARSVVLFDSPGSVRDWLVLLAWLGLSVGTITVARRARARAGVAPPPPLRAGPVAGTRSS